MPQLPPRVLSLLLVIMQELRTFFARHMPPAGRSGDDGARAASPFSAVHRCLDRPTSHSSSIRVHLQPAAQLRAAPVPLWLTMLDARV